MQMSLLFLLCDSFTGYWGRHICFYCVYHFRNPWSEAMRTSPTQLRFQGENLNLPPGPRPRSGEPRFFSYRCNYSFHDLRAGGPCSASVTVFSVNV
ncbi:hypothetical protein BJX70DRAFT_138174 [Aspergillus crustosus]